MRSQYVYVVLLQIIVVLSTSNRLIQQPCQYYCYECRGSYHQMMYPYLIFSVLWSILYNIMHMLRTYQNSRQLCD